MRELLKKLRPKPNTLVSIVFLLVFFLVAVFLAITQEAGDADSLNHGDLEGDLLSQEDEEEGIEPEFVPAGPPRWFRSNAGGMALEEIPSQLGALRNKYALVIDYWAPEEMDPRLTPFYKDEYIIEVRILYKDRKETRKQWLLRDEAGNTRVNAVFRPLKGEGEVLPGEPGEPASAETQAEAEIAAGEDAAAEGAAVPAADGDTHELALADTEAAPSPEDGDNLELALADTEAAALAEGEAPAEAAPSDAKAKSNEPKVSAGFIEVFNENGQIEKDYSLFEDGSETLTDYFYKGSSLIRAETKAKDTEDGEYRKIHTDTYRYNRSYSLRNVERVFHEASGAEPVRLVFPGRVLDAASDKNFIKDKLTFLPDFFGSTPIDADYRMVYDTDARGRVLGQTLYNGNNEVIWKVKNNWAGDRITSIVKIEGDNEKRTEYDYDGSGNRIAERDIQNGVLERHVLINGSKETEELYLNGVVVLRAFWEDGRKISEERVRRR